MRANRSIHIGLVLAFLALTGLVAACESVPVPETPRQALGLAEITFQGLVVQATGLKPTMSAGQIEAVGAVIHEIDAVLAAARLVVDAASLEAKLAVVQQSIRRLRLELDKGGGK